MIYNAILVERLVREEIDAYRYEEPEPGDTVGKPWSKAEVDAHIRVLNTCLVPPRLERFLLAETAEHDRSPERLFADYWIVAEAQHYVEWFDPGTGEFGLAKRHPTENGFVSIGVRGDLVGVFCAM